MLGVCLQLLIIGSRWWLLWRGLGRLWSSCARFMIWQHTAFSQQPDLSSCRHFDAFVNFAILGGANVTHNANELAFLVGAAFKRNLFANPAAFKLILAGPGHGDFAAVQRN